MNKIKAATIASCAIWTLGFGAQASPITLDLHGAVNNIYVITGPTPTGAIALGDAVTLRVTYDPDTLGLANFIDPPGTAVYAGAIGYAITLPGYERSGTAFGAAYVSDNATFGAGTGFFDTLAWNLGDLEADQVHPPFDLGAGTDFEAADFTFRDDSATAIDGFGLPTVVPISSFDLRYLNLDFFNIESGSRVFVQASLDGVQTGIPEPATWALMIAGFGVCGVGLRVRRMARTALENFPPGDAFDTVVIEWGEPDILIPVGDGRREGRATK